MLKHGTAHNKRQCGLMGYAGDCVCFQRMLATVKAILPDNSKCAHDLLSRSNSEPNQPDKSGHQQSSQTSGSRAWSAYDKNYLGHRLKGSNSGHCFKAVLIIKFA